MPVLNTASNIMIGATQAKKVYQGPTHVWPPAPQGFQASWTNADMNTLTWGTNPFNPRSITGLTAWFDASDTLPITSQWYDKSLTGHHGTIYGSPMPTIQSNWVGQLSVMWFKANEGRVRMTGTGITNDWTLVYVGRQEGGSGRVVSSGVNNLLVGWWGTQQDGAYDATPGWLVPDVKVTTNNALYTMYSADGSPATAMRLFKNGTLISSGSVVGNTGWGGTFNINGFGDGPGSTEMCSAVMGEVLLYNRKLSDTERQQCETYLNNKWRGASTYPKYLDLYYSTTLWSTSDEWLANGTWLENRDTSGVQSYTHMKSAADKNETILYYALIERNATTGTISIPAVSAAPRVRGGTDWKQITIAPKSGKVQALYHIQSGTTMDAHLVATGGNYTVDWGDGTAATNHNAGDTALHTYAYSSMPAAGEIAAGRQAMATISAQSGQTMTGLALVGAVTPPPSPPKTPETAHQVSKGTESWRYSYTTDDTYRGEPRDIQTVWLKITPNATGSYTIFEDSGEDTYGYLYSATPVGPGYDNWTTSDNDTGPGYGYQITATLNAGTTYYIASSYQYLQVGGTRPMRVNVTGGSTTGMVGNANSFPVEVSVASDHLRSLDVKPGTVVTGVNFLSKMSADSFDHMFDNLTSLASVCGEMKCLGTSAAYMFNYCTALKTPLPRLETSGVTDFKYMFRRCNNTGFTTMTQVIDTSAGTDFSWMFTSTWYLTTAPASLATGNGTDFSYMFAGAALLTFPTMDTGNGTNFENMFESTSSGAVIPALNTSKGTNFKGMFQWSDDIVIPWFDTSNGTDFSFMFGDSYTASVPAINTSKGVNFEEMFNGAYNTLLTTLPTLDTANGTNFNYMFAGLTEVVQFPITTVAKGTTFTGMFYNCWKLTSANLPPGLTTGGGTSLGTDFSYMFYGCKSVGFTAVPALNTANGTNFRAMFRGCTALTSNGSVTYNLASATSVMEMFYGCNAVGFTASPVLSNTGLVTDFSDLYYNCSKMTALPVLDTSSATSFFEMFRGCRVLVSNGSVTYNSANVTNFSQMFVDCDGSGFTVPPTLTSTSAGTNFMNMHNYNSYITAMPNYDTSNGTNFTGMFQGCGRLVNAGVRVYNTSKGTAFNYTFATCNNAGFTAIPAWNMSAGTTFTSVFSNCPYVTIVNATGIRYSVNIGTCAASMSAANINTFLTNLGTAAGAQTVTLTGLTNQASSNKAIATAKGWTVTPA